MSTGVLPGRLGAALFGKTRRTLLALFFGHPDEAYYLREVVRTAGVGQGAIQRELSRLMKAGLLTRQRRGNQVYYQADPRAPIFADLKSLAVKTAGAGAKPSVRRDALLKRRIVGDSDRDAPVSKRKTQEMVFLARQLRGKLDAWIAASHPDFPE